LSGLFDFFQSASNTVADNVAGPVDLINAGLGLFGLRSKEPVGGSEWMKRWGLKRDVEMGGARLAGETAGLLSPTLLAAKAPQIAKGLLQAQENAAIPRQMHPEMGAIVYHGSPHKFDKFDSSKIGTGEGAQAYGHGLYLAESPDVAKSYQRAGMAPGPAMRTMDPSLTPLLEAADAFKARGLDEDALYAAMRRQFPSARAGEIHDAITLPRPSLYKVDLPDTAIAKMLDWDKPLSQQAPEVASGIQKAMLARGFTEQQIAAVRASDPSGEKLHAFLGGIKGQTTGADVMRKAGIPGIRYLDGGSRGAGSGTSNYVVFPGEEGLLKILERNGGLMGP
jgi:hypothetical protein